MAMKGKDTASEAGVAVSDSTAVGREFNPRHIMLKNKSSLQEFLMRCGHHTGEGIKMKLMSKTTDYKKAPGDGGVYIAALTLALGVHFPLPPFARKVLSFYQLAPTQISPGSWRVILGFEALCAHQRLNFGVAEFQSLYQLKHFRDKSYCFSPRKGKLIIDVPDTDSGWHRNIVHVVGPWESIDPSEQGTVPRAWNPLAMTANLGHRQSTSVPKGCVFPTTPCVGLSIDRATNSERGKTQRNKQREEEREREREGQEMKFVMEFAENLILRLMEDPKERDEKARHRIYAIKEQCKKTKENWSLPIRPYGFWTFDRFNAQLSWDSQISQVPGHRDPYDNLLADEPPSAKP